MSKLFNLIWIGLFLLKSHEKEFIKVTIDIPIANCSDQFAVLIFDTGNHSSLLEIFIYIFDFLGKNPTSLVFILTAWPL